MLWYHERIQFMKSLGEFVHTWIGRVDDADVGYTLTLIHLLVLFTIYGIILFTQSPILLFVGFLGILTQFILNLVDNGCFMIKAERKYLGKEWYSFYTLIADIFHIPLSRTRVILLYYTILCLSLLIIVYKYILWIRKWIYFIIFVLYEFNIIPVIYKIFQLCLSLLSLIRTKLQETYTKINNFYTRFEVYYSTQTPAPTLTPT